MLLGGLVASSLPLAAVTWLGARLAAALPLTAPAGLAAGLAAPLALSAAATAAWESAALLARLLLRLGAALLSRLPLRVAPLLSGLLLTAVFAGVMTHASSWTRDLAPNLTQTLPRERREMNSNPVSVTFGDSLKPPGCRPHHGQSKRG